MAKKKEKKEKMVVESIEEALSAVRKKFGKGSVKLLGDKSSESVDVISTGSYLIDKALGVGGFPRGRIVELAGVAGGGKTTVTLHTIAEAQKRGEEAAFIDAEHALDVTLAKKVGVDIDRLVINQPDCGEQGLEIVEMLTLTGKFAIIVVDSVSALTPRAEIEGEMGDNHPGLQARMMGQALRKLTGIAYKTNTLIIFINQIRKKIGIMFGNPETTSGGEALKFFSSVRMDIRPVGQIKSKRKDETIVLGNEVQVKIVKNKLAIPFQTIRTDLIFGKGFNKEGEVLDLAMNLDIVDEVDGEFTYKGAALGKQRLKVCSYLRDNPQIYEAIKAEVSSTQDDEEPIETKEQSDENSEEV